MRKAYDERIRQRVIEHRRNIHRFAELGGVEYKTRDYILEQLNALDLPYEMVTETALIAWLDTGTPNGMLKAAQFVEAVQDRQGFYVSCIEEIAWRRGFITTEQLRSIGESLKMTDYGQYLLSLAKED